MLFDPLKRNSLSFTGAVDVSSKKFDISRTNLFEGISLQSISRDVGSLSSRTRDDAAAKGIGRWRGEGRRGIFKKLRVSIINHTFPEI